MEKKSHIDEHAPLQQVMVNVLPDLRLVVLIEKRKIEIHLTPEDAIDVALQLFEFAYELPGKHQDRLRSLAGFNQPKENIT